MAALLNPYLTFSGTAREAMEYYRSVFGGELTMNTFGEYGMQDSPQADGIMHAQLQTENGLTLMGSDNAPETDSGTEPRSGDTITISLSGDDAAELRGYWERLSDGGTVTMALEKQVWGDEFGMCTDKFGVPWMVNITAQSN